MEKKVILTGASGFIGQQLGIALVEKGYQVISVARSKESIHGLLAYPCEALEWDKSYHLAPDALSGATAVIHLAGASIAKRWSRKYREEILASRTQSTAALCQSMQECAVPPKLFIQASATGYYGDAEARWCVESDKGGKDFLATVCREWEQASAKLPAGTRRVIMRFGLVFGWNGGTLPALHQIYTSQLGATLGSGQQWVSWIHVNDLVNAIIHAIETPKVHGIYNTVATPVTFSELNDSLGNATRCHVRKTVPSSFLRTTMGEQSSMILNSARVSSQKLAQTGFQLQFPTLDAALQDLYTANNVANQQVFVRQQWIPSPPPSTWDFFANEANLEQITPKHLQFQIIGKSTPALQQDTRIFYKLRLRQLPIRWQSHITTWQPPQEFVDEQVEGPYAIWSHQHRFQALGQGTLMTDFVRYKIPMSWVSNLLLGMWVTRELKNIFAFRARAIRQLFDAKGFQS